MKWLLALLVSTIALVGCSAPVESAMTEAAGDAGAPAPQSRAEVQATPASTAPVVAQREIIRRGTIRIQVDDIAEAESKATAWVKQAGGFVQGSFSSDLNSVRASISITLRVPVKTLDAAMNEFSGYGTVLAKGISSEDVTTQLVDLRARLKVLREQEIALLGFLRESKTLKDSLAVNAELTKVRQEIESMDAIRRSQEELAALSTLEVTFVSSARIVARPEPSTWAQDAFAASADAMVGLARAVGAWLIGFLVFSPFWLPFVVLALWIRHRKRRAQAKATL